MGAYSVPDQHHSAANLVASTAAGIQPLINCPMFDLGGRQRMVRCSRTAS